MQSVIEPNEIHMTYKKPYSTIHLIAHSLEPTAASVIGCLLAAVLIILVHVFIVSLYQGTLFPGAFNGQLTLDYNLHVVQPVETLLNMGAVNKTLMAGLWGVIGLLVYAPISYVVYLVKGWRHPEGIDAAQRAFSRKEFAVHVLWRFCIGLVAAALFYAGQPLFRYLIATDLRLFNEPSIAGMSLLYFARAIGLWACILHVGLVLLRLYLFRTRIFGELLY